MYGVVLAAMLTTGSQAPQWGWHGCWGCHSCWSCYSCHGCWSYCSCHGCWGCHSYVYLGCACSCFGCFSCHAYYPVYYYPVYYYPVYTVVCSCSGCSCAGHVSVGTGASRSAASAAPPVGDQDTTPLTEQEKAAVRQLLKKLRSQKPAPSQESRAPARITVQLPAEARLYVNEVLCPLASAERSFQTPPLEPGRNYSYTLRAELEQEGQRLVQVQRVQLHAGGEVRVRLDFTSAAATARQ